MVLNAHLYTLVYCYGDREDILIRDFLECEFILCALNS